MEITYEQAYTEVFEVLSKLPIHEYNKIPKETIEFYKNHRDKAYEFEIDANIPIKNQNISKRASTILVTIYRDVFADEKQKEILENLLEKNRQEEERKKKMIYDVDNIF